MFLPFVNRNKELRVLAEEFRDSHFVVMYGRRRIGKTRLIKHSLEQLNKDIYQSVYLRAIKATSHVQLQDLSEKLNDHLSLGITIKSYKEFFRSLELLQKTINKKLVIVLDEFPYLVESNQSLPSILQEWLDEHESSPIVIAVLGSSESMMHDLFLNDASPLYKRARRVIRLEPIIYKYFAQCLNLNLLSEETFKLYSLVGGIPKYWQFIDSKLTALENANRLFYDEFSFFETDMQLIFSDEGIRSQNAESILQIMGKGAVRASEISSRIGIKATDLSRPLNMLIDAGLIESVVPFGEKAKTSKKIQYILKDLSVIFSYKLYMNHSDRWHTYSEERKKNHLIENASFILKNEIRKKFSGKRYWEDPTKSSKGMEFDCVVLVDEKMIDVYELKWTLPENKDQLTFSIQTKFQSSKLYQNGYRLNRVHLLDIYDAIRCLAAPEKEPL